ncbi:MAG: universal stress protein [Geminicoccaceae bacterium]
MTVKDLLVHVDANPNAGKRLEAAMVLAESFRAHLSVLALVAEPFVPAIEGVHIPQHLLEQQLEAAEREAEAVLAAARATAERRGIAIETRRETGTIDQLPALLARQARHADLTLVGQPDLERQGVDDALLVEAAFMDSGRPALVIPYIGARIMPPKRVLLGWDGSREASRAAHDALPLLTQALAVTLLVVDPQRHADRLGEQAGADLAAHLARHGVRVEVKTVASGGLAIGDVILAQMSDEAADLLVMGGYGHSRLREFVLGGVTRRLLEHMTCPVLLAH